MSDPEKIRVAILGGGLAGATLLRGLLLYPHLDVNIYESRPAFKEEGAGIGLQSNAIDSLRAISPALIDALSAAGAVTTNGAKMLVGCGPDAGQELDRGSVAVKFRNVGRHAFLQQLLADIPEHRMHASKKLLKIEQHGDTNTSTLHFADGPTSTVDVVLGADGVHGLVRGHVLGQQDPATPPRFAGWWHSACLVPLEKALPVLGPKLLDTEKPSQHIWIGTAGQAILHDFVHDRKWVQCIICVRGDKLYDPRDTPFEISREQVLAEYAHWPEKFSKGYVNLLCDHAGEPLRCFPQMEHAAAPTYVTSNAAVIGDAAHCTTPWQGSGAAMAIEDSLVLSRLLGKVTTKAQVPAALKAYDVTRRPRTQRLVESSRGTGMLLSGRDPDVGLDRDKLQEAVRTRWDFLHDFDPEEHVAGAMQIMQNETQH